MTDQEIWERERGFWLDGVAYYHENMVEAAQMVFPDPVGILKGSQILEGLEAAPRWTAVEMGDRTEEVLGDTRVLAYRATGTRDGSDPYVALCSSTYVRRGDRWILLSHQQTPLR